MDTQHAPAQAEMPVANDVVPVAPAPAAPIPTAKVFLAFAFMAKDGNGAPVQRVGRTFLAGAPDLYTQGQIESVEAMIAENLGLEQPQITSWQRLIA